MSIARRVVSSCEYKKSKPDFENLLNYMHSCRKTFFYQWAYTDPLPQCGALLQAPEPKHLAPAHLYSLETEFHDKFS